MAQDGHDHTISGLLRKRAELLGEAQRCRNDLANSENAIESIDRVLECLGCTESLINMVPSGMRIQMFDRHGLSRFVFAALRSTTAPVTSRQLAVQIIVLDGRDPLDRALVSDVVDRVGRALRRLRRDGAVVGEYDDAKLMYWKLAPKG